MINFGIKKNKMLSFKNKNKLLKFAEIKDYFRFSIFKLFIKN